jgi:hypothetical protein
MRCILQIKRSIATLHVTERKKTRTLPLGHGGLLLYRRIGDGLTHRYDLRGDAGDAVVGAVAGRFNLIVAPTKG